MTIPTHPGFGAGIERLTRRRTPQRIPVRYTASRACSSWTRPGARSRRSASRPACAPSANWRSSTTYARAAAASTAARPATTRRAHCPAAVNIPHQDIRARRHELDPGRPTVMFCNGPQCTATPQAIAALLAAGHPAQALLYYRGGIHDWVTLGLPLHQP